MGAAYATSPSTLGWILGATVRNHDRASTFWAAKARDKEQLLDPKGLASAARDSLLDARGVAEPLARGEGL